ncbi:type II toxin-antitoxin system YafQ family toxin [Emergencia sp.]|uniref:type II toxin-antitoxin system RelE/ParE family toxin n=1 Tax=Emergencia sp. TaxID=1926557 RepID=UPI003AF0DBC2
MISIRYSAKFKKDYKTNIKRGYDPRPLEEVLDILCNECPLPSRYKNHSLTGNTFFSITPSIL